MSADNTRTMVADGEVRPQEEENDGEEGVMVLLSVLTGDGDGVKVVGGCRLVREGSQHGDEHWRQGQNRRDDGLDRSMLATSSGDQ